MSCLASPVLPGGFVVVILALFWCLAFSGLTVAPFFSPFSFYFIHRSNVLHYEEESRQHKTSPFFTRCRRQVHFHGPTFCLLCLLQSHPHHLFFCLLSYFTNRCGCTDHRNTQGKGRRRPVGLCGPFDGQTPGSLFGAVCATLYCVGKYCLCLCI